MDQNGAQSLVDAARAAHPDVDAMFLSVDAQSSITIEPTTERTWGTKTDQSGSIISVCETAHPSETLFHELLHIDLKLRGFRTYSTFMRTNDDHGVMSVAIALDNELQHHRMFPAFTAAGFDPERFYCDDDSKTYDRIRVELKRMDPENAAANDLFLKYLSVVAPGGAGTEQRRNQLLNYFRIRVPKPVMTKLDTAADLMRAWGSAAELDAGPVIRDILEILGNSGWWIGASKDFPADGFFVGPPFAVQNAVEFS